MTTLLKENGEALVRQQAQQLKDCLNLLPASDLYLLSTAGSLFVRRQPIREKAYQMGLATRQKKHGPTCIGKVASVLWLQLPPHIVRSVTALHDRLCSFMRLLG